MDTNQILDYWTYGKSKLISDHCAWLSKFRSTAVHWVMISLYSLYSNRFLSCDWCLIAVCDFLLCQGLIKSLDLDQAGVDLESPSPVLSQRCRVAVYGLLSRKRRKTRSLKQPAQHILNKQYLGEVGYPPVSLWLAGSWSQSGNYRCHAVHTLWHTAAST